MKSLTRLALLVSASIPATALAQEPPAQPQEPRYLPMVREELEHMGLQARCTTENANLGRCRYSYRSNSLGVTFDMVMEYSDESDTVYMWANRYLMLPASSAHLLPTLRRMMEMNNEMLVGKLEWDPSDGETRLGAVVSTDSNFDRRAFRSTVRALHVLCERYFRELSALARGEASPGRQ
ncbi:MAG: hypothetical protein HYY06_20960 [Deltaproteobacteria bacterium]|nr:hypothetical protein [Deltaproteobacteria bacterium]